MRSLTAAACLLMLFSCSREKGRVHSSSGTISEANVSAMQQTGSANETVVKGHGKKVVGGIRYSASLLPATEFLRRKGETISESDKAALSKETVLLLEMELPDLQKDIWKYPGLQLSEDDAVNYLVGELVSDITITQNGKEWTATGSNFEGKTGAIHKIRVQLFFGDIDCAKALKVAFYDRLFGAGLIKFGINER